VTSAELVEQGGELLAVGVAPVVVGHDGFDAADPNRGEVLDGSGEEPGAG
jgi:hypothetical protein